MQDPNKFRELHYFAQIVKVLIKGIEFLPQTTIFLSLYLCNRMVYTFDISNLIIWSNNIHTLKYQRSITLGCKDIAIRKFEFVAKTQFLSIIICRRYKDKNKIDSLWQFMLVTLNLLLLLLLLFTSLMFMYSYGSGLGTRIEKRERERWIETKVAFKPQPT